MPDKKFIVPDIQQDDSLVAHMKYLNIPQLQFQSLIASFITGSARVLKYSIRKATLLASILIGMTKNIMPIQS